MQHDVSDHSDTFRTSSRCDRKKIQSNFCLTSTFAHGSECFVKPIRAPSISFSDSVTTIRSSRLFPIVGNCAGEYDPSIQAFEHLSPPALRQSGRRSLDNRRVLPGRSSIPCSPRAGPQLRQVLGPAPYIIAGY